MNARAEFSVEVGDIAADLVSYCRSGYRARKVDGTWLIIRIGRGTRAVETPRGVRPDQVEVGEAGVEQHRDGWSQVRDLRGYLLVRADAVGRTRRARRVGVSRWSVARR